MESNESFPYIDETQSDDDLNPHNYKLKIIENYENQNRNIEITNRYHKNSLAPVATSETELSDYEINESNKEFSPRNTEMKLVITSWNSNISIQSLDNKSSITFRRKGEKSYKDKREGDKTVSGEVKSKKGKWKMLTRSIMLAKSARFEKRSLDERYPKYVLLKDEEEEISKVKENYPKIFGVDETRPKRKSEFSFKKSFKNKTEPISPPNSGKDKTKKNTKLSNERSTVAVKKKMEKTKSKANIKREKPVGLDCKDEQVCSEIQEIFDETLNYFPQTDKKMQSQKNQHISQYTTTPQFCELPCNFAQIPKCVPVYTTNKRDVCISNVHCHHSETGENELNELELENISLGLLSSFFPEVVIMNTIHGEQGLRNVSEFKSAEVKNKCETIGQSLEVPQAELALKSKTVTDIETDNLSLDDISVNELLYSENDQKTKSQGSETTEYLHFSESAPPENESIKPLAPSTPPPQYESKTQDEIVEVKNENNENLSLTKIGYKMYDNLTKLSLNREKETMKKQETMGCGFNGNETKKSPYNITLESNNKVLKVTIPENELNFHIVNAQGEDIKIGIVSKKKEKEEEKEAREEEKKMVKREELWYSNNHGNSTVLKSISEQQQNNKMFQKLRVSVAEDQEVILSIEMNEKEKQEEKLNEKVSKEKKVGTDDFDVAGGDFACALDKNCKNLSPRVRQLLEHLHHTLEYNEKQRKFFEDKIQKNLIQDKFKHNLLPGLFLVQHMSPRTSVSKLSKKVSESQGEVREYYCEECLATMRIFEDENPSVKSMVDKFETIIQQESF